MSQHNNAGLSWSALLEYPYDIRMYVLEKLIEPELLEVEDTTPVAEEHSESSAPSPQRLRVKYSCGTDGLADTIPKELHATYWNLRAVSWLKSWKYFSSPHNFIMAHHLLSEDPQAALPAIKQKPAHLQWLPPDDDETEESLASFQEPTVYIEPLVYSKHSRYTDHGLEKIVLEFDAVEYFELFDVTIPPFDDPEGQLNDPLLRGAASMLQHCENLTLVFGKSFHGANPWFALTGDEWEDAKARANVCESGKVVDWILEYAWDNNYLQHIKSIKLEGDIQTWVCEKWDDIFKKWTVEQQLGNLNWKQVHDSDIEGIEMLGMVPDQDWHPQDHCPPLCTCTTPCSQLAPFVHVWEPSDLNIWDDVKEEVGDPAEWDHVVYDDDDPTEWK